MTPTLPPVVNKSQGSCLSLTWQESGKGVNCVSWQHWALRKRPESPVSPDIFPLSFGSYQKRKKKNTEGAIPDSLPIISEAGGPGLTVACLGDIRIAATWV